MIELLIFATTLLIAVFFSELAGRSVLSGAVLFLVAGLIAGPGVTGWMPISHAHPGVAAFSKLALFSVLFTDGMRISPRDASSTWRLPGQALLLGFPLNLLLMAATARFLFGLSWPDSLLIGTVLSPTDPVFAAAIVGREEIPPRIRHLLNVESGVNDGIALPLVVILIAVAGHQAIHPLNLIGEVALGVLLGIAVPWTALRLERSRLFGVATHYQPFLAFAIALFLLAVTSLTHANEFLAAFFAGLTLARISPKYREEFHQFGERLTELLKLAALLVFGASISGEFLFGMGWLEMSFVALALFVVRPLALLLALWSSRLGWNEWFTVAWFGPRGFASVVFGLLVLQSDIPQAGKLFHLIAIVVAVSIVAHSSSDVLLARWLQKSLKEAPLATPTTK